MKLVRDLMLSGLLFGIAAVAASAQAPPVDFAHFVTYPSGGLTPASIAVADINNDGKLDVVVANRCADSNCLTGTVGVLLGNGDGTFQPVVIYASGGSGATAVTIADVNNDGKPDVLVANGCVSSTDCSDGLLGVLLGNGDGSLQAASTFRTGGAAYGLGTGDVNHDGKLDVILGTANGVTSLIGNGSGSFGAPILSATGGYGSFVVADFNGDGIADAAFDLDPGSSHNPRVNGAIGVVFGNGDGTFHGPISLDAGGFFPQKLAIADMNRHGRPDILLADKLGRVNQTAGSAVIFFNAGGGSFGSPDVLRIGGIGAFAVAGGDYNGDGIPDVVVSEGDLTTVVTGGATNHRNAGGGVADIAIADINGDGQPDLLSAVDCFGCSSGVISVLLSKPAPTKTRVASSLNPSQVNQSVTFTATITCAERGPVGNGKTISFFNGKTLLGTSQTVAGVATFTTSSLPPGKRTIRAVFGGYPFLHSSSGTVKQVVNP
jgi:hypothetical protein